jgi:hypothetical protein
MLGSVLNITLMKKHFQFERLYLLSLSVVLFVLCLDKKNFEMCEAPIICQNNFLNVEAYS